MQLVYGAQERLSDTARGMKGGCSGVCLEEHSWRVDLAFRWHCTGHCQKLSIPRPPQYSAWRKPKRAMGHKVTNLWSLLPKSEFGSICWAEEISVIVVQEKTKGYHGLNFHLKR